MIAKVENDRFVRLVDCNVATVVPEITKDGDPPQYSLVVIFDNGKDITFPLSQGDKIWYLNNDGKTIEKDFRMCCQGLN